MPIDGTGIIYTATRAYHRESVLKSFYLATLKKLPF
jgi:hypothetical protein